MDSSKKKDVSTKWEKVLWKEHPNFPDHYTGPLFLESLVVNADIPRRSYWRVVTSALTVLQQLASVSLAAAAAYHLHASNLSTHTLIQWETYLFILGALVHSSCTTVAVTITTAPKSHSKSPLSSSSSSLTTIIFALLTSLGGGLILTLITLLLAPILASLATSISSDSIVASSVGLLIVHLYLFDYRIATTTARGGGGGLGGGAALCSALLISSRLQSNLAVFSLVFLALELFILGPFCWRAVGRRSEVVHSVLTVACTAGTAYILRMMHSMDDGGGGDDAKQQQAVMASVSFIAASVFVGLLCPMWLVKIHKFKAQINGPWDEAIPRLSGLVVRSKE